MDMDAMEGRPARAELDLAVKHPAALEGMRRNVEILLADDREARQHRVAVMAMPVDRGLAVGDLMPDRVGDELVLRLRRPVVMSRRMALVNADDFLQEKDVGVEYGAHL